MRQSLPIRWDFAFERKYRGVLYQPKVFVHFTKNYELIESSILNNEEL